MNWASADLGDNEAQLLLHDPANGVLLDMKKSKLYSLPSISKHEIEIIYSRTKKLELENSLLLSKPFPNPSTGEVTFNLFSGSAAEAQLDVFDLMGRKVHTDGLSLRGHEINKLKWFGKTIAGEPVPGGVYIYKLTVRSGESTKITQGRIIIQ